MTYNEKKSLYESIMKDVSKIVKKKLNEEFIDKLKDDELHQERDFIKEEIDKSVEHLLDGKYDKSVDIDLQRLTRVYPVSNTKELNNLIWMSMRAWGDECSLNWIDTSKVKSMVSLFEELPSFCGDISRWDVSKVVDFTGMFRNSNFRGDISKWKISPKAEIDEILLGCNIALKHLPKGLIDRMYTFDFYDWQKLYR